MTKEAFIAATSMAENRRFSILPQRNHVQVQVPHSSPPPSHSPPATSHLAPHGDNRAASGFQRLPDSQPLVQYVYLPQPQYQMAPIAYQPSPQLSTQLSSFQVQQLQQAQYMAQQNYIQIQQTQQQHHQLHNPNPPPLLNRRVYSATHSFFLCILNFRLFQNLTSSESSAASPKGSVNSFTNSEKTTAPPPGQSLAESTYIQILEAELKKKETEIDNYKLILPTTQNELKAAIEDIIRLSGENEVFKQNSLSVLPSTSHLQDELETTQKAYRDLQLQFTQEKQEIEANFHETTKVIESNYREIDSLKTKLADTEAALQAVSDSHRIEIDSLLVKMKGLELHEQRVQDMERDLNAEKIANERLRRQVVHLEQHSMRAREVYDQMKTIIEAKNNENARLAEEISALKSVA
ncbi:hypothetical protein HK096_007432, partial [Nowakowskiella sp. JEL0078]